MFRDFQKRKEPFAICRHAVLNNLGAARNADGDTGRDRVASRQIIPGSVVCIRRLALEGVLYQLLVVQYQGGGRREGGAEERTE